MAFPTYTLSDLTQVSGRSATSYSNAGYVPQAILEATLLFQLGTNLSEPPSSGPLQTLMRLGILKMADSIYLSQPSAEVLSAPYQSETIGSYSYSRLSGQVMNGLPTGVTWFDLAVSRLKAGLPSDIVTGGFEVFENGEHFRSGHIGQNQRLVLRHEEDLFYDWTGEPVNTHGIYATNDLRFGDALNTGEPLHVPAAKAEVNLTLVQGSENTFAFRYLAGDPAVPVDLSGYTAHAQLRASYEGELWLDLTTGGHGITLDNAGYITVSIPHATTQDQSWAGRSNGVWDLELTDGLGNVERFIEGTVVVSHEVTR